MATETISTVLNETIREMSTGTLYELTRGLMLSTCTLEQFLDAMYDELDKRAEAAKRESAAYEADEPAPADR